MTDVRPTHRSLVAKTCLTSSRISKLLRCSNKWVHNRIARDLPPPVECASSGIGQAGCRHYSAEYAQLLWEERAQQYAHLLSGAEAAAQLGYHPSTIRKLIAHPGVKTEVIYVPLDWSRKNFRRALSDWTMAKLVERKSAYATHEYFNVWQLKTLTGHKTSYIRRRLSEAGLVAVPLRAASNQKVNHWSRAAIDILGGRTPPRNYPPGGDWMTVGRIKVRLRRGELWLRARIKGEPSEIRLDDNGHPRRHYSPQTYRRLERAAKSEIEPEDKSLLTIKDMAEILEVTSSWVKQHLSKAPIDWSPSRYNRFNYYPSQCLDWLKQQRARQLIQLTVAARQLGRRPTTIFRLLERHPEFGKVHRLPRLAGKRGRAFWLYITPATLKCIKAHYLSPPSPGWYTANQIACQTGRHVVFVRKSLSAAGLEARLFKKPNGQPSSYFPPGARDHVPRLTADKNDWYTIGAMARKLKRSWNWVNKHVRQEPFELRTDSRQVMTKHYRPCVYTRLRIISSTARRTSSVTPAGTS